MSSDNSILLEILRSLFSGSWDTDWLPFFDYWQTLLELSVLFAILYLGVKIITLVSKRLGLLDSIFFLVIPNIVWWGGWWVWYLINCLPRGTSGAIGIYPG